MSIELNRSQENFAAFVLNTASQTSEPQIIFGVGFTGIGKQTVFDQISGDLNPKYAKVVPFHFFTEPDNWSEVLDSDQHLITSFSMGKMDLFQKVLRHRKAVGQRVKPMDANETLEYIAKMRTTTGIERTSEDLEELAIAAFTMGIYSHINRYFDMKSKGIPWHPLQIKEDLKNDMPDSMIYSADFADQLDNYSNITNVWGFMGLD